MRRDNNSVIATRATGHCTDHRRHLPIAPVLAARMHPSSSASRPPQDVLLHQQQNRRTSRDGTAIEIYNIHIEVYQQARQYGRFTLHPAAGGAIYGHGTSYPPPPSYLDIALYLILMPLSSASPSLQAAAELRPVLQYAVPVVNAEIGL